jgi:ribosomal protein L30E
MTIILVDGMKAVVIIPKTTPEAFQERVKYELLKQQLPVGQYRFVNQKDRGTTNHRSFVLRSTH